MARKNFQNFKKRSGASFETVENFTKATYTSDATKEYLDAAGVPLAQVGENVYLTSKNELHCFVIGDSGCGKSRRVIMPSIHMLAKAGESMVVSDPKGELYKSTSSMLRKKGYEVLVLNFRTPERGNRWNPMGYIEELYNSGTVSKKDAAMMMITELADTISQSVAASDDPYWSVSASAYFRGVVTLILEFGGLGELTLENVSRVGRELGQCCDSHADIPKKSLLRSILSELPPDSTILNNISSVTTNSDTTRNCILSIFESMLSLYSSQYSLMDLFAKSEIDISSIGLKPTALFFILPDDSQALYPIATVFVKQIYSALIGLADSQPDGKLPTRVTFLLDEFANFAKLPSVESMLTAARSRGIRFVLVCQSMDQLSQKYKAEGMEILLANCRCWIFMSCRNLTFLERLQSLCGKYRSPYTGEVSPLITIDRLQQFEMGQILVLNDRCKPFIGYLTKDYLEIDFGPDGSDNTGNLPPITPDIERKVITLTSLYENRNSHKKSFVSDRYAAMNSSEENSDRDETPTNSGGDSPGIGEIQERAYSGNFSSAFRAATIRLQSSFTDPGILDDIKCCMASCIVFGNIVPPPSFASVSLKFDDLIAPLLQKRNAQAFALAFLNEVEKGNFASAERYIDNIPQNEWSLHFLEWHKNYWGRLKLPKMALIALVARCRSPFGFPIDNAAQLVSSVYDAFPEFSKTDVFKRLTLSL